MKDTWEEILDIERDMNNALSTLRANGNAYANAEIDYRIAKAKKIMEFKQDGYPVTLIPDLVKGSEEVSELLKKKIVAETLYKTNLEALKVKEQQYSMHKVYFDKEYSIEK